MSKEESLGLLEMVSYSCKHMFSCTGAVDQATIVLVLIHFLGSKSTDL